MLLREPFGEIMVPRAVAEVRRAAAGMDTCSRGWDRRLVEASRESFHQGGAETIALAAEAGANVALLDGKRARRTARRLGLKAIGTLGVLLLAKRRGLIDDFEKEVKKLLDKILPATARSGQQGIRRREAKRDC